MPMRDAVGTGSRARQPTGQIGLQRLADRSAGSGGRLDTGFMEKQEEAAERLGVSRTTLSRTLAQARHTVAAALIGGRRLVLEPRSSSSAIEQDQG